MVDLSYPGLGKKVSEATKNNKMIQIAFTSDAYGSPDKDRETRYLKDIVRNLLHLDAPALYAYTSRIDYSLAEPGDLCFTIYGGKIHPEHVGILFHKQKDSETKKNQLFIIHHSADVVGIDARFQDEPRFNYYFGRIPDSTPQDP